MSGTPAADARAPARWIPAALATTTLLPVALLVLLVARSGVWAHVWFWVATAVAVGLLVLPTLVLLRMRSQARP